MLRSGGHLLTARILAPAPVYQLTRGGIREAGERSMASSLHAANLSAVAKEGHPDRIGVVDTMFARVDMGREAIDELSSCPGYRDTFEVLHRTVPGIKDLAVECKKLIEEDGCRVVIALGMPGRADIDQVCAHEASLGIMQARLATNTHILEVFVHESEEDDPSRLVPVCIDRARSHALNAYWLCYEPEQLASRAGKGIRQGYADAGPLQELPAQAG